MSHLQRGNFPMLLFIPRGYLRKMMNPPESQGTGPIQHIWWLGQGMIISNGKIKTGNQTTNQIRDNTNLIFFDDLGVMTMNQYFGCLQKSGLEWIGFRARPSTWRCLERSDPVTGASSVLSPTIRAGYF